MKNKKLQACKWYAVCPIKRFTEEKKLDPKWTQEYCLVSNPNCLRYRMEECVLPHPDTMLPDGTIDPSLA